jgi:hypothetical protein
MTSDNTPTPFEQAAAACMDKAIMHAANADDLLIQAHHIWLDLYETAIAQQQLAMVYLAVGGFHEKETYDVLGLPFEPGDVSPDQYIL